MIGSVLIEEAELDGADWHTGGNGDIAGWGKKFKKMVKKVAKVSLPHKIIPGAIGKKLDSVFTKLTLEGRILDKVTKEKGKPAPAAVTAAILSPSARTPLTRGLPGDPEAWRTERKEEAELEGVFDAFSSVFSTAAPAVAQSAAPAAGSSWLDTAMNAVSKGLTSGLTIANQAIDLKAKAKAVRNNTVAKAYTTGAINGQKALSFSKGDVIPRGNSWFDRSDLIAGVPNLWIAGGAAGLLAMVLIMKKRQA